MTKNRSKISLVSDRFSIFDVIIINFIITDDGLVRFKLNFRLCLIRLYYLYFIFFGFLKQKPFAWCLRHKFFHCWSLIVYWTQGWPKIINFCGYWWKMLNLWSFFNGHISRNLPNLWFYEIHNRFILFHTVLNRHLHVIPYYILLLLR